MSAEGIEVREKNGVASCIFRWRAICSVLVVKTYQKYLARKLGTPNCPAIAGNELSLLPATNHDDGKEKKKTSCQHNYSV